MFFFYSSVVIQSKADGIHRSAQTGNRGHILVGTGSGIDQLINDLIILRGVTLDCFVPAVLLCIGANTAEEVAMQGVIAQCSQIIVLIGTGGGAVRGTVQPAAPIIACTTGISVVLVGGTVGHKHDHQVSILVVCRIIALNSGA